MKRKKYDKKRTWISLLCAACLLVPSVRSMAGRPETVYTTAACLTISYQSVAGQENYAGKIITYYPEKNKPHQQLAISPVYGTASQSLMVSIVEFGAKVFSGQTFSQIYVENYSDLVIGERAFYGATVGEVEGSLVKDHTVNFDVHPLREIGDCAFAEMKTADDFIIDRFSGKIGYGAFCNTKIDGTFRLAGQIDTLGENAFAGFSAGGFDFSDADFYRIEDRAFQQSDIKEFTVGDTVTYLGSQLFNGSSVKKIYLPEKDVEKEVEPDAFPDDRDLTIVIADATSDLSIYHFDQYQNVLFQIPEGLDENSPVLRYLQENHLRFQIGGETAQETTAPKETATPGTAAPQGTEIPGTAVPQGTEIPGTAAPQGTEIPGTAAPQGTEIPGTAAPQGTEIPGTAAPQGTEIPGTAAPQGTDEPGTAAPQGTEIPGTAAPQGTEIPGTAAPQGTEIPGTAGSQGTVTPETAAPQGTEIPGTAGSQGTAAPGTAAPQGTAAPGTVKPQDTATGNGSGLNTLPSSDDLEDFSPKEGTAKKKTFTVKKIKYRISGKNKVAVLGTSDRKLQKISIPDTILYQKKLYKVVSIESSALQKLQKLKRAVIGDYVKQIKSGAFAECPHLVSISFGNNLESLGKKVLYRDSRLKKIIFKGKKLKKIGEKTFFGVPKKTVRITAPKKKAAYYKKMIEKSLH